MGQNGQKMIEMMEKMKKNAKVPNFSNEREREYPSLLDYARKK